MTSLLISVLMTLRGIVRSRAALHLEVLALRHQLQVVQRVASTTTASGEGGPVVLGVAVTHVEQLANHTRHRDARDRYRLASPRLPVVLVLEKSTAHRATTGPGRCPPLDSDDGAGQSALGSAADSRRIDKTRGDVSQATVAKCIGRRDAKPSCLHGHSAFSGASSRHCGDRLTSADAAVSSKSCAA